MNVLSKTGAFVLVVLAAYQTASAQAPVEGQPYQVPAGFRAYGPGSLITYGGRNYVVQTGGTMLLVRQQPGMTAPPRVQSPVPGQAYQIPVEFANATSGTTITYGGYKYVIKADRTMVLVPPPATDYVRFRSSDVITSPSPYLRTRPMILVAPGSSRLGPGPGYLSPGPSPGSSLGAAWGRPGPGPRWALP